MNVGHFYKKKHFSMSFFRSMAQFCCATNVLTVANSSEKRVCINIKKELL